MQMINSLQDVKNVDQLRIGDIFIVQDGENVHCMCVHHYDEGMYIFHEATLTKHWIDSNPHIGVRKLNYNMCFANNGKFVYVNVMTESDITTIFETKINVENDTIGKGLAEIVRDIYHSIFPNFQLKKKGSLKRTHSHTKYITYPLDKGVMVRAKELNLELDRRRTYLYEHVFYMTPKGDCYILPEWDFENFFNLFEKSELDEEFEKETAIFDVTTLDVLQNDDLKNQFTDLFLDDVSCLFKPIYENKQLNVKAYSEINPNSYTTYLLQDDKVIPSNKQVTALSNEWRKIRAIEDFIRGFNKISPFDGDWQEGYENDNVKLLHFHGGILAVDKRGAIDPYYCRKNLDGYYVPFLSDTESDEIQQLYQQFKLLRKLSSEETTA